jgi:4-hydroxybenzoate polyprenyltransferase
VTAPAREKATGVDGQIVGGSGVLVKYANFVKLPHTLFALPFAITGLVLGTYVASVTLATIGWVVLAFTSARFAAMGFNRIVDREYDARNPRTAMRELPTGAMSLREASIAVVLAGALFIFAAWRINPLCFALSPVALAWVFFYSYTKRFTRWSHLVLGLGLGIAPVGGYLAVTGAWSDPWYMLVALAFAVTTWTAGFDIIYSSQDVEVDRREGLHSLPAALGPVLALFFARALHLFTFGALLLVANTARVGFYFMLGVLAAGWLLLKEHQLVKDEKRQKAFFTLNVALSSIFLAFVLMDRFLPNPFPGDGP